MTVNEPPGGPKHAAHGRLDSWKEIAVYLDRSLRTVQRWERERGLPVHRTGNDRNQGSVFAFTSELDAWWESHANGGLADNEDRDSQDEAPQAAHSESAHGRRWILPAAAAVVLFSLASWYWGTSESRRRLIPGSQTELRLLAKLSATAFRVSPDGRRLALVEGPDAELRVRNLDTGEVQLLGNRVGSDLEWSRDSRFIAAATRTPASEPGPRRKIEVFDIEGGQRREIWHERTPGPPPLVQDWTPDGTGVVCLQEMPDHSGQVVAIPVDGGAPELLAETPALSDGLQISPDGRFVAYESCPSETNCDIYVASIPKGEPVRLTDDPGRDGSPHWSIDGKTLYFGSGRRGRGRDIWALDVGEDPISAPAPRFVRDFPSGLAGWRISQRGELSFGRVPNPVRVHLLPVDPATGHAMGEPESPFPDETRWATWVNGGASLALIEQDQPGLFIHNLATGEKANVLAPGNPANALMTPSPDGRRFVFRIPVEGGLGGVFVFERGDKEPRLLHKSDGFFSPPFSWSPDGRRVLYTLTRRTRGLGPVQDITVTDVATGESVVIAKTTGRPPFAVWSPRGDEIAFTDGSCLFTVRASPPKSGLEQPRRVTCAPSSDMTDGVQDVGPMGQLSWSPDGEKLAWIINSPERRRVQLRIVNRADGSQAVSWEGGEGYSSWPYGPSWSPAGDQLAFELRRPRVLELWSLSRLE